MKKSTVNSVPVNGSNLIWPEKTTATKCKRPRNKSSDMMIINGARNSRISFRNPIMTSSEEIVPRTAHPSIIILNHKFTVKHTQKHRYIINN